MNEISARIRKNERQLASSLCFPPCGDTARSQPSANQEEDPHQNPATLAP